MSFDANLDGNHVYDSNFRLRFLFIFFCGIIAASSIVYWRSKLLVSQEYVDFPQHEVHNHKPILKAPAETQRLQKELNQNEQDKTGN